MLPDLARLLQYENHSVQERYRRDFPDNKLTSEEALRELLKFFWLSLKKEEDSLHSPNNKELDFICGIHSEMKEIDDMWHSFLLFTKDYASFCQQYFGEFFHHTPTTDYDSERIRKNSFDVDFSRFLSYIYDNLGEETVIKWFGALIE